MRWEESLACFFTWTTYGTWLHGDKRGSYNRKGKTFRERFVPPNFRLEQYRRDQLRFPPLLLDAKLHRVVRLAVEECCAFREWRLLALNVRTNHAHAVIAGMAASSRMLHDVKSLATRKLREARLVAPDRSVWTANGSTVLLYDAEDVAVACEYVINGQGPPLPEE